MTKFKIFDHFTPRQQRLFSIHLIVLLIIAIAWGVMIFFVDNTASLALRNGSFILTVVFFALCTSVTLHVFIAYDRFPKRTHDEGYREATTQALREAIDELYAKRATYWQDEFMRDYWLRQGDGWYDIAVIAVGEYENPYNVNEVELRITVYRVSTPNIPVVGVMYTAKTQENVVDEFIPNWVQVDAMFEDSSRVLTPSDDDLYDLLDDVLDAQQVRG